MEEWQSPCKCWQEQKKNPPSYGLGLLKFIYSERAIKFCEIFTVDSKVDILQKFVAFSEYMNFIRTPRFSDLPTTLAQTHCASLGQHEAVSFRCVYSQV